MPLPEGLRLCGVRKVYGDVVALDGLDLDAAAGECVALIGHNGSGKTTAVRLAAGQLQPTAGAIALLGWIMTGPLLAETLLGLPIALLRTAPAARAAIPTAATWLALAVLAESAWLRTRKPPAA